MHGSDHSSVANVTGLPATGASRDAALSPFNPFSGCLLPTAPGRVSRWREKPSLCGAGGLVCAHADSLPFSAGPTRGTSGVSGSDASWPFPL